MNSRILVVDDEPDVVGFLSRLLEDNGYATYSANSGNEAFLLLQEEQPRLILLDLQMANGTGTDLYRMLRARPSLKGVPIIVVSGVAGRRIAVGKEVPVIDKPIDDVELLAQVRKALGERAEPE